MALMIGGPKKTLPPQMQAPEPEAPAGATDQAPDAMPQDAAPDAAPDDAGQDAPTGAGLDPSIAGYKTPDMGPFNCGHCVHYEANGPNTCAIVAGEVEEEGVCNVFTPMSEDHGPDDGTGDPSAADAAPALPEAPPEEPAQPPTQ